MWVDRLDDWQFVSETQLSAQNRAFDCTCKNTVFLYRGGLDQTQVEQVLTEGLYHTLSGGFSKLFKPYEAASFFKNTRVVAINLDAFEAHGLSSGEALLSDVKGYVESKYQQRLNTKSLHLLGLGDVGATLSIGLKLLGGKCIDTLGLYDINPNQIKRWEMELNQVILNPDMQIKGLDESQLFDCDVFVFCASKYIPALGEQVKDVRMAQYETNAELLAYYAKLARESAFKGLFLVVSDPVDFLCQKVYMASNRNEQGVMDYKGLLPEQVRGYGLGVMDGRARYYAQQFGYSYEDAGRVFGPHGADLVVADDLQAYNHEHSLRLTEAVVRANLEMRGIGYKPYIAPALSSGAVSIVNLLEGKWHDSATFVCGVFFGMRNRLTPWGTELENLHLPQPLIQRLEEAHQRLEATWKTLNA